VSWPALQKELGDLTRAYGVFHSVAFVGNRIRLDIADFPPVTFDSLTEAHFYVLGFTDAMRYRDRIAKGTP
jgi:hypothetical protein